MEDQVKDLVIALDSDDLVLMKLVEITINSIRTGRELFPNPLEEPYFWRKYFRQWVIEGLQEARKIAAEEQGKQEQE